MRIAKVESFLMQAGSPSETAWSAASAGGLSTSGTRHWCFTRVTAEDGTYGVGEGSGWPKVVKAAIDDLAPLLVGEDARNVERLAARLHLAQMGHGLTGTPGAGAISGLEMALWDLNGKALGVPVWRLLGGRFRDRVPAYAHASTVETAERLRAKGYRAFKCGGVNEALRKVTALRQAMGDDIDLMVDLHGPPWLTPADAKRLVRQMEPLNLLFVEEPVAPEFPGALAEIRAATCVPIAAGERTARLQGLAPLITGGAIDVAQPDTGRFGGIAEMRKIAAVAEAHGVTLAPHAGTLGPVAEFAALHFMASIPNALALERFGEDWAGRAGVVSHTPELVDGSLVVPDRPGLGVDIDLDFIAAHPPAHNTGLPRAIHEYAPGTADENLCVQARRGAALAFGPRDGET